MDMMTQKLAQNNMFELDELQKNLKDYLHCAAVKGASVYEVEKNIFSTVLEMGKQALNYFFRMQGNAECVRENETNLKSYDIKFMFP